MADAQATLPVSLLTGFLGSGKTTLLRRALLSPAFADTAVVINEIGAVGLDHYLVETMDGPALVLPGGCLCCELREDLAASLRGLMARREAGAGFRRVVVETTGLADPAPILFTLAADPTLDARLRLDRVVATVDAVAGTATLARFPEAARQAALADRILVTKTDLAPLGADLAAVLDALNPDAERAAAIGLDDPGASLFGGGAARVLRPPTQAPHGEHAHGIAIHAVTLGLPPTRLDFARALGGLARERGADLLRVKGLVEFADRPGRPAFVQGAQHAIYPPDWLDAWPDQDRRSRLVLVAHDIAQDEILARFAFAGAAPWAAA